MSFTMPTTPNSRSIRTAPSTTPAGNPPSYLTNKSTTPAGRPPRATFGSSFNPATNTFGKKATTFGLHDDEDVSSDEDADGGIDELYDTSPPPGQSIAHPNQSFAASFMSTTSPRGLKRSRDGRPREQGTMAKSAKSFANKKHAPLREKDDIILRSEGILADLDTKVRRQPAQTHSVLTDKAAQLTKLWRPMVDTAAKIGGVGPTSEDGFTCANYLASLLLALHHPHTDKPGRAAVRGSRSIAPAQTAITVPRALLDWLDTYHKPFEDDFEAVRDHQPSPSAHESFWDAVFGNTLRGKLDNTMLLLRNAGLEYAASAMEDFEDDAQGYTGDQLRNANIYMQRCARTLQTCPGLNFNNWDVKDHDWKLFRQQLEHELEHLFQAAEGDGTRFRETPNTFKNSNERSRMSMSTASRRAMSQIPWSIFENLSMVYHLLLGSPEQTLMISQDWLEASLYLTIWWDGDEEGKLDSSLRRSSMRKSLNQKPRPIDVNPFESYRDRLALAFARATEEEDPVFKVQTIDPIHVGLGCVLEDAVAAVVDMLQMWSMLVSVSIVEIAALGDWLPLTRPRSGEGMSNMNFSKEDLLVLSAGPKTHIDPDAIDRDEILSEYADLLASKTKIHDKDGWELAVAILNRLDQPPEGGRKILDLLDTLELHDEVRVDKVLGVCDAFELTEQRRSIAERFADSLAERRESHGAALIYYARAHASAKLKDHIETLTSMCLLHSVALPTASEMDTKLESLLSKDRSALKDLAKSDLEAATLLSTYLSGYATLRKFYDVRDQDVYIGQGVHIEQPLKSLDRRRQAAASLFAVAKSAADCVSGGLYDPEVESVVPVDGLLVLFGEALPLLGQDIRIFTQQQTFSLLRLVEDFVASPSRIRENADSLLSASLTAHKEATSTATGIFKKKRSDLSASSSWDMMASMMAQSQDLNKLQRAWDWRQGLVGMGGGEVNSDAVVKLFREALIREVAGGWSGRLMW